MDDKKELEQEQLSEVNGGGGYTITTVNGKHYRYIGTDESKNISVQAVEGLYILVHGTDSIVTLVIKAGGMKKSCLQTLIQAPGEK